VPELFSQSWIEAIDELARDDPGLRAVAPQIGLVLQQTITSEDAERCYHIVLVDDEVRVRPGPAHDPTIWFTTDISTATAIATGAASAQAAFIAGQIRVGGDLSRLLEAQAGIAGLGDPFASVRCERDST